MKTVAFIAVVVLVTCGANCSRHDRQNAQVSHESESAPAAVSNSDGAFTVPVAVVQDSYGKTFEDFFSKRRSIHYKRFQIARLRRVVRDAKTKREIPITYAVLRKDGRRIATFDGVYFGSGNSTRFGLAPMLGPDDKQLIVSQTVPRGGRHWVVDVSKDGAVLFDSYDYEVGTEDVCLMDVDKDGVFEIGLAVTTFWGFRSMSMAESPLPTIVFKYYRKLRKYLPANPHFGSGLENIETDAAAVKPEEKSEGVSTGPYLAKRLDILLRYVYAGKKELGWEFFNRTYNLRDKDEVKTEIEDRLAHEPVYRFICCELMKSRGQ